MKITITLGEILDRGYWDQFCAVTGYNVWCLNKGTGRREDEYTLSVEQAEQIGLLPRTLIRY